MKKSTAVRIRSQAGWLDGLGHDGKYEWTENKSKAWPLSRKAAEARLELVRKQMPDAHIVEN